MTTHPMNPVRSEKGVALIIVLLLLAVMAGLTTGLSLNGQTEIAMAHNETYYAGARAAAEAGMNRAVEQIVESNDIDLLAFPTVPDIGNGPFDLTDDYSYRYEIIDDDDPSLYPIPLTADQLAAMGENGDGAVNLNTRMLLRCIGMGPRGTVVTVTRVLSSTEIPDLPETETLLSNPAIIVNGNLDFTGNAMVKGLKGNVHANGNITGNTSKDDNISGDVTATGTVDPAIEAVGMVAGSMPSISLPVIQAEDYENLADYILRADGTIRLAGTGDPGTLCGAACPSNNNWTWQAASSTWRASGTSPKTGTYYAETNVEIHGTGGNPPVQMSVIAEGSIKITGNGKFSPENGAGIQFVTNGDFVLGGTVLAEDTTVDFDGQIMAREQIEIYGTSKFQGRVMAENRDSASNACTVAAVTGCRRGTDTIDKNSIHGTLTVTYNGNLGDIETPIVIPGGASTYTNNISGWIEQ
jgi:cytoskeletal protein CcmA (bactofilin family)